MSTTEKVVSHYAKGGLFKRIMEALKASGIKVGELSEKDLKPLDEFHIGGIDATIDLLKNLDIKTSTKVLDLGSGIGGLARHITYNYNAKVTGIDLTPEFVNTAIQLTKMTGLDIEFHVASALDIPITDKFDILTLLHVGMNLPDKAKLFSEANRMLVPGGTFAIYDIMTVGKGNLDFPVPWASDKSSSFVDTLDSYHKESSSQSFIIKKERNRADFALDFFQKLKEKITYQDSPSIGLHIIMGEDAKIKINNVVKAIEDGHIAPIEIILKKPD